MILDFYQSRNFELNDISSDHFTNRIECDVELAYSTRKEMELGTTDNKQLDFCAFYKRIKYKFNVHIIWLDDILFAISEVLD